MKHIVITLVIAAIFGLAVLSGRPTKAADTPAAASKVRIGTYDSRAVAMAYARSSKSNNALKARIAEHAKAKKEGNEKLVKEIEEEMSLRQDKRHWQVFYDGNIDDVLEMVKPNYAAIAQKAGVTAIARRVDFKDASIETVDVTEAMAAQFEPDEKTLKLVRDMMTKPLVSFESIKKAEKDGSL